MIGGFPGKDVAAVIAQPKLARSRPKKTDFETSVQLRDRGATELHKPGNEFGRILVKTAVYLDVSSIPALRHLPMRRNRRKDDGAVVALVDS